jgi:hypothetical protein
MFVLKAAICLSVVFASLTASPINPHPAKKGELQVTLELSGSDRVLITIRNQSAKSVTFSPRADLLICYHEAPGGKRTALTWDGSNAEMMFLTLKDVITLKPGASHRLKRALWIEKRRGIDRSRLLKTKGQVYAVVRTVALAHSRLATATRPRRSPSAQRREVERH